MLKKRIIPCLDIKSGRVVKGTNFKALKEVGDPVEFAQKYSETGADEICFLDIAASEENRGAILEIISRTAKVVFVPLTVGGGVSKPDDIQKLLWAGADKVSLNSGAVKNPELIKLSAQKYGSQCTILAIDAKRSSQTKSGFEVFIRGGKEATGLDVLEWAQFSTEAGAGEILLTSMDADGTKSGYDIELTNLISQRVKVPVIASGGAGQLYHLKELFQKTKAQAALLASVLHYGNFTLEELRNSLE